MSDEPYPYGEVGQLLQTFLNNRVEAMQTEGLKVDGKQWTAAWDVAYQLRGLITSFWADNSGGTEAKASLNKETLRFVEKYTQALPDNSPDVSHLIRLAREHVFAELVISNVMPELGSRVRWLASKSSDWNFSESSKSLHYLRKVASSYLFGMDEVCLVMCRASLEAWLEANVSNDVCLSVLGKTNKFGQIELAQRIEAASDPIVGVLPSALRKTAEDVRKAGNKAIHHGIKSARKESERCIGKLMVIINSIPPSSAK